MFTNLRVDHHCNSSTLAFSSIQIGIRSESNAVCEESLSLSLPLLLASTFLPVCLFYTHLTIKNSSSTKEIYLSSSFNTHIHNILKLWFYLEKETKLVVGSLKTIKDQNELTCSLT